MFLYSFTTKQESLASYSLTRLFVVVEGLEPSQAEPESEVLPLHYTTMVLTLQI